MGTRIQVWIYCLVFFWPLTASALDYVPRTEPQSVRERPIPRCTLDDVLSQLQFQVIEQQANIARQQQPALSQLRYLSEKAKDPKRSVGEQLSRDDIAKFSEIRQRLLAMKLATLLESKRKRDLTAIRQLIKIADQNYRWGEELKETDPEYFLQGILTLWRLMADSPETKLSIAPPSYSYCSLEWAAHLVENEALEKLNKLDLGKASEQVAKLAAMYGKPIDRNRLSPAERTEYDALLNNYLRPSLKEQQFIFDLEAIKAMIRGSELIYESDRQDALESGGDINAIGSSISRRVDSLDKPTTLAIGLWRKIDEKMPADAVKQWEQLAKEVERIEKRNKK